MTIWSYNCMALYKLEYYYDFINKIIILIIGDDLVDLDSHGWLPYTEICRNLILAWTTFPNLLPIVYYGGGWFVALRTTLVHATDDDYCCYYYYCKMTLGSFVLALSLYSSLEGMSFMPYVCMCMIQMYICHTYVITSYY